MSICEKNLSVSAILFLKVEIVRLRLRRFCFFADGASVTMINFSDAVPLWCGIFLGIFQF